MSVHREITLPILIITHNSVYSMSSFLLIAWNHQPRIFCAWSFRDFVHLPQNVCVYASQSAGTNCWRFRAFVFYVYQHWSVERCNRVFSLLFLRSFRLFVFSVYGSVGQLLTTHSHRFLRWRRWRRGRWRRSTGVRYLARNAAGPKDDAAVGQPTDNIRWHLFPFFLRCQSVSDF